MPKTNGELSAIQEQARAWRLLTTTLQNGHRYGDLYRPGSPERVDCVTQTAVMMLTDEIWANRALADQPASHMRDWFEQLRPTLQAVRSMIRGSQQREAHIRRQESLYG